MKKQLFYTEEELNELYWSKSNRFLVLLHVLRYNRENELNLFTDPEHYAVHREMVSVLRFRETLWQKPALPKSQLAQSYYAPIPVNAKIMHVAKKFKSFENSPTQKQVS